MLIHAAVPTAQPDPVALVMALAFLAFVAFLAIRKYARSKKPATPAITEDFQETDSADPNLPVAPGAAGQLKLHTVEPRTAAMLMAIVAEKTGKPLNELRFISIKEVETE